MIIKAGAGISSFGYPVAMGVETETNTRLGIRVLALDDEFMVATIIISWGPAGVHLGLWEGSHSCFERETRRWW